MFNKINIRFIALLLMCSFVSIQIYAADNIDKRKPVFLSSKEKALVLEEMRGFLAGVNNIIKGISTKNLNNISESAQKLGLKAAKNVPPSLTKKLPNGFKKLAADTHMKFDEIARDAKDFEDEEHSLSQVATLLDNCVACHATYRFEIESKSK